MNSRTTLIALGVALLVTSAILVAELVLLYTRSSTPTPEPMAASLDTRPQEAEAHYQTALQHYNNKEWALARREAETVLQLKLDHPSAPELLVRVKLETDLEKRYADAQDKRLGNVCGASDDFAWVYARRKTYRQVGDNLFDTTTKCAGLLLSQGNYQEAINYLRTADDIKADATTQALLSKVEDYQRGIQQITAQQWEDAIAALSPVFAADANFLFTRDNLCKAFVERGKVNDTKGEWEAARADFQQALQVKADCPNATDQLQQVTAKRYTQLAAQCQAAFDSRDYATAKNLGEQALQLNPQGSEVRACVTGPQPVFQTIASSLSGFSGQQDANRWSYWMTVNSCSSLPTSAYDLLHWDNDTQSWQPPLGPPWVRIERDGAHPNRCNDVVRRWTSNYSGQIRILITLRKYEFSDYQGNGVRTYISVNQNATPAWQYTLDCCNARRLSNAVVATLNVQRGTTLDFGLNSRGDTVADHTYYEVVIQSVTYP